jgi:hypothetical protein
MPERCPEWAVAAPTETLPAWPAQGGHWARAPDEE